MPSTLYNLAMSSRALGSRMSAQTAWSADGKASAPALPSMAMVVMPNSRALV